jgi:long-chain acyl-CoA synthetase
VPSRIELLLAPTAADDTAVIYTSGTTGLPKGGQLSHFQLYMHCTLAIEVLDVRDDDVMLGVLPLFHVFGLSTVLNACVRAGVSMVLLPRFSVDAVLEFRWTQCSRRFSATG